MTSYCDRWLIGSLSFITATLHHAPCVDLPQRIPSPRSLSVISTEAGKIIRGAGEALPTLSPM